MNEGSTSGTPPDDGQKLYQPEQVITPSAMPHDTTISLTSQTPASSDSSTVAPIIPSNAGSSSVVPDSQPAQALSAESAPTFDLPTEPLVPATSSESPITWTASEFIANQKSGNWYAMLAGAAILIGFVVWLFTRDFFPTAAVLIGVILLGYYAGRQPREETYSLDDQGLTIGSRHLPYHEFKSFAVVQDGAFLSIELAPLKRFAIDAAIYIDPDNEQQIIDRLSRHLPMEEAKTSLADSLMRRIKF